MKSSALRFFLALLLTLSFVGYAVATATVVSPNGGEFVSGTFPVSWTASDAGDAQAIDFNLYYSLVPGTKSHKILETDLTSCDVGTETFWANTVKDFTVGLPIPVNEFVAGAPSFYYEGKSYVSILETDDLTDDKNIDVIETFYWDPVTDEWVDDSANFVLQADANFVCSKAAHAGCSATIFNIESTYYMISTVTSTVSGADILLLKGWKLNNGVWEKYQSIIPSGTFSYPGSVYVEVAPITSFRLDDVLFLMLFKPQSTVGNGPDVNAWFWDGSSWSAYLPMTRINDPNNFGCSGPPNCPTDPSSAVAFEGFSSDTNFLILTGTDETVSRGGMNYVYSFNGSYWELRSDLNNGLDFGETAQTEPYGLITVNDAGDFPLIGGKFFVGTAYLGDFNVEFAKDYGTQLNTSSTFNCSYSWDTTTALNGNWFLDVDSDVVGNDSSNAKFTISNFTSDEFEITAIENITNISYDSNGARLSYSGDPGQMVWKSENKKSTSIYPRYILNGLISSDKIAFVYTSTDGETWTFDDTLTYGSSVYDPVQKIWDANNDRYDFSFIDGLDGEEETYYKVKFESVPFSAIQLRGNVEWVLIPGPDTYSEEGSASHGYDLFNDSNYTNLQIYSKQRFSELVASAGLNAGYELQFTAFADAAGTIKAGYRVGSTDTTSDVTISTFKRRYSVPINTDDFDAQLLVKSVNTSSNRFYFSDWAIVPRSYFASRLEIYNADGSAPNAIVRDGNSHQYIQEGDNFRFAVTAFDKDLDLRNLKIDVLIGNVVIKTYNYDLGDYGKTVSLNEIQTGIIDYNGAALVFNTLQPLRDLTVKATLINDADENVAEQYETIKLLQYPYFPNDLDFFVSALNHKVGDPPSFSFSINQKASEPFMGLIVSIYDANHSASNPNFEKTIYAEELGCATLLNCAKMITLDEWLYPLGNYSLSVGALLKTEPQLYTNPLTLRAASVLTSYVDVETARVLQVFERSSACGGRAEYNNTERMPIVFQVRTDTLENMGKQFAAYLTLRIYDGAAVDDQNTMFNPGRFIYDELTGYNYWYWDDIFYTDAGNLLPDGNSIAFKAYLIPVGETSENTSPYGLTDKCNSYPSDFFCGSLIMDWVGFALDASFGCTDPADFVVSYLSGATLDINASYVPLANQNHSVLCVRADETREFSQELGDDFLCALVYLKSEEQIDKFDVFLSNAYSDFSLTGSEAQYINFAVDQSSVMFNDILMLRAALATEFDTGTEIHTLGQLISATFNKILPYGQGVVDYTQWLAGEGYITNAGADINLEGQLDPNLVSGMFFFKVSGMSVINQYDYISAYPELETFNPKYFRRFANDNGISLPINKAVISVYARDFSIFQSHDIDSPLVIFEKPSVAQTNLQDTNITEITVLPTALKFNFIVDMFSANETKGARAFVPIVFSYFVPTAPINIIDAITTEFGELVSNPVAWALKQWFFILLAIIGLLVFSLIYSNFRKGGTNINIVNKPNVPGG